jgi:nitroimidazol reductase NimA-like FMN-containing flavoprotein (pyridoxamine 5'-phosphate oxidase superfamily)
VTTDDPVPSDRSRVRRKADRGRYDRATIDAILDEAVICHVGVVHDGTPVVLPTVHARVDDVLYLHGAAGNQLLRDASGPADVCVAVTLVDGVVFARTAFHHSINYRSAVLFGRASLVQDDGEKRHALDALVEHVACGRAADARPPTAAELRATAVVRFPIHEASAKIRTGGPIDDVEDLTLPVWSGVVPLRTVASEPITDDNGVPGLSPPAYARNYTRP